MMQIILASAKIMRETYTGNRVIPTEPQFQRQAATLAADLGHKTSLELSELMSCNPEIGELNRRRYEIFGSDEAEIIPAIFAYYGQAYKHLKADTMGRADLEWANSHLLISSCLYGLLRPFDGINLYRMEGGFSLQCTGGRKVQDWWRPILTDALISAVKADDGTLVYLDTEEFRGLFDWKRVISETNVIEPEFHILKGSRLTTPSVWAKTCRGAMARFIVDNRLDTPSQLHEFSYEGFVFDSEKSIAGKPVFIKKAR